MIILLSNHSAAFGSQYPQIWYITLGESQKKSDRGKDLPEYSPVSK